MRVRCGTDIIEVNRMEKSLASNARFAEKVFTEAEIEYCESKNAGRYESYAVRFAAKEALLKAMGVGMFAGAALTEIEIINDAESGAPSVRLYGGAAEIYKGIGGASLSVSLSHTSHTAIAMVVMLCE